MILEVDPPTWCSRRWWWDAVTLHGMPSQGLVTISRLHRRRASVWGPFTLDLHLVEVRHSPDPSGRRPNHLGVAVSFRSLLLTPVQESIISYNQGQLFSGCFTPKRSAPATVTTPLPVTPFFSPAPHQQRRRRRNLQRRGPVPSRPPMATVTARGIRACPKHQPQHGWRL